jgi:hypothetical protein
MHEAQIGDVVRVHDRRDWSWLGVVKRAERDRDGHTVYVCDLWRVEAGELVEYPDSPHHAGEFVVVARAVAQDVVS